MKARVTIAVILLMGCAAFGYTNLGGGVYRSDGSASNTQAAINAATDGQTVQIPNGTYTWTTSVEISGKAITLTGQSVGGVTKGSWDNLMAKGGVVSFPTRLALRYVCSRPNPA